MMKLGALDYITKDVGFLQLLPQVMKRGIKQWLRERELERAIKELEKSEEKHRSIFETAANLITSVDSEGIIVNCNQRITEVLGYQKEEIIGQSMARIIHPDYLTKAQESLEEILATGFSYNKEYKMVRKDKGLRDVSINSSGLKDGNGSYVKTICIISDITEQKKMEKERKLLEAQLRQSQKLESIGTLASGVAHEINNPLTGIINYAQLVHDDIEDKELKEYTQGIMEEGHRVAKIVKDLLTFARFEKESHSPARMEDIINSTLSLIGSVLRKEQIEITRSIPPDLPLTKCRSQQIQQVILNLLTNARDALNLRYPQYHENKKVNINVSTFEKDGVDWVRTTVEDHGTGISEKVLHQIFDPFFTTKGRSQGTGLGLSVSYGIVKEHHGELWVETKAGEYTRFHMDLRVNNGWSLEKKGK